MNLRRWVVLGLVLAGFLAGCKNFWKLPSGSGSGSGTGTTLSSGIFYVLDQTADQIVAYDISSGVLNKIGTYTVTGPTAMAVSPNGSYLYVSTLISGIFVYNVGSGGALTLGNNGAAISSDPALALAVDTTDSWLIDSFINAGGQVVVDATPLNSTGTYTAGATVASAAFTISNATVKQMALSSDDANIFVALGTGGTIIVPFSSSTPLPAGVAAHTISVLHNEGSDLSVAVDPSTRLFYIGEANGNSAGSSGGLRYFDYSTLAEASGSPLASGGLAPAAILPLANGDYVYLANGQGESSAGNVAWFSVSTSGTTTSLSSGSTAGSGVQPIGLAAESDGNFVLAVSEGDNTSSGGNPDLDAYTMSTGALTSALTSSTGTDPVGAIAIVALP